MASELDLEQGKVRDRMKPATIERLATQGQRRATRAGDVLCREGDHQCDFYVILDGSVTIVTGHESRR